MAAKLARGLALFKADPGMATAAKSHASSFSWQQTVFRYAEFYE